MKLLFYPYPFKNYSFIHKRETVWKFESNTRTLRKNIIPWTELAKTTAQAKVVYTASHSNFVLVGSVLALFSANLKRSGNRSQSWFTFHQDHRWKAFQLLNVWYFISSMYFTFKSVERISSKDSKISLRAGSLVGTRKREATHSSLRRPFAFSPSSEPARRL